MEYTITLYCDNTGANFLANNFESRRTKHLDIKHLFLRDLIVDKVIRTKFVKSDNNKADPFTKNVSEKIFLRLYDYLKSSETDDDNVIGYDINFVLKESNSVICVQLNSPLSDELIYGTH